MISNLIAVNGSPLSSSRTSAVANAAVEINGSGKVIQLGELDAEALLARGTAARVDAALEAVRTADALVVASPVYRRTYSGLLKAFFDLFGPSALAGIPALLVVTAGHDAESLCIDHGLRPLVASLDGWTVPTSVVAVHSDFDDGVPSADVRARLARALEEAALIVDRDR